MDGDGQALIASVEVEEVGEILPGVLTAGGEERDGAFRGEGDDAGGEEPGAVREDEPVGGEFLSALADERGMYPRYTRLACASCNCHARPSETACPSCGAALRNAHGSRTRTTAAALLGLVLAGAAEVGCGSSTASDTYGVAATTGSASPGGKRAKSSASSASSSGADGRR